MLRRSSCTRSGGDQLLRCSKREWRDWASLPSELTEQISSLLLRDDVTEYLRFRAACKSWRTCTEDPRSRILESVFRPRRWIILSNCDGVRRRFLNLTTGACVHMDLPELSGHHNEGSAEGLLVLRDKGSNAIRLLHPFTRSLVDLPSVTTVFRSASPGWCDVSSPVFRILRACISDETSPPTVALFLFYRLWNIAYAKPGDERWSLVDDNGWKHFPSDRHLLSEDDAQKLKYVFYNSAVTQRGRIYFTTSQGNVVLLRLHPRPRMVLLISDHFIFFNYRNVCSYLVPADDDGESLLMVRFHYDLRYMLPSTLRRLKRSRKSGLFKLPSCASWRTPGYSRYDWYQLEVFEVDMDLVEEEQTITLFPVYKQGIGQRAVFLGDKGCVSVSTRVFPSVYSDAVYFGLNSVCSTPAGVRRLNDGTRAEPRLQLLKENGDIAPRRNLSPFERIVPPTRPCSLEEYLIGYVSCKSGIKD